MGKTRLEQEVIDKLEEIIDRQTAHNSDKEADHSEADDILCDLLKRLGYGDVVAAWEKVPKWYA